MESVNNPLDPLPHATVESSSLTRIREPSREVGISIDYTEHGELSGLEPQSIIFVSENACLVSYGVRLKIIGL